ncbi:MAG: hypothetical protein ABR976_09990 [Terracidiphilus sp.]|jgi:hypothetical protein
MRRQVKSMLLLGALTIIAARAGGAHAQSPTQPKYPVDVALTYDATRADVITNASFWMQGGTAEVHGQFYKGWGVVAEVNGLHTANIQSSGVSLDLVTASFGPRYTWTPAHARYSIFGQMLVGETWGLNSVFPSVNGAMQNARSLAVEGGGGFDVALTPHVSLRAIKVDWLRTQLPNSTTNVQNDVTLGAGVVIKFR